MADTQDVDDQADSSLLPNTTGDYQTVGMPAEQNRPPVARRAQPFPPRASIELWGRFHRARIAPCNFFMANCRVEVIGHSRLQAVEINMDENPISPRVDSGKRPGNRSGNVGQSDQPSLTVAGANGSPSGKTGSIVS